ncbi:hypothetical protein FXF61_09475 [Pseudomonas sp. C27(2019)]|uniref:DUF7281 domain-containing protein n=1 Tax=Pseudomonas sp. C27(2019) TaxID=2604941 RepID=UPI00124529AE|nr:hypothetical protein [Pseudomonas sp. C27(2019)]QEY59372.1 hypothetical protein FXF61_09475 [Pseudomonas sp. C27(2019)]
MSIDLEPSVRKVLQRINQQLQDQQQVQRKAQQASMQQLQLWCDRHELDTQGCFGHTQVLFDRRMLQTIEQTLSELNLASLDTDLSQTSRLEQGELGDGEYKSVGESPTEKRVLVAQANCGAYFPEWVKTAPSQWVMDIAWSSLQLDDFTHLLVVENRDVFYQYFALHPQRYSLPEDALSALVIYRGDGEESKGCKALREACLVLAKPVIYFGDYDTAGLNFAINGGYTHLLLPTEAELLQRANAVSQDAKQIHLAASVTAFAQQLTVDDPLQTLLLHNTQQQKGLRQQAFQGPLQLLAIKRVTV